MLTASSDGDAGPEGCWTEVVALLPGVEVVLVAPTAAVVERNTAPQLGVEAPPGQCFVESPARGTEAGLQVKTADSQAPCRSRLVLAGVEALHLGHEPVVVAETAAVREGQALGGLLVIEPSPVIPSTGPLRLGLETDGSVMVRHTERLTVSLCGEPVCITQTPAVCEGSGQ